MPTYRVIFVNGEKRELTVSCHKLEGHHETPTTGTCYVFSDGDDIKAVVPKAQVLYIERVN